MRDELQRLAEELHVSSRIRFTGAVAHARVPELLAAMDLAVAPYLASDDFYFSPIKVYEYLAAQLPVIASDIGQISELIAHGRVLPCVAGDAHSLQQAVQKALEEPAGARESARRGAEWVLAQRTWRSNAERIVQWASSLSTARI